MKKAIFIGCVALSIFSTACFNDPPQTHVCVFHAASGPGVGAIVTIGGGRPQATTTDANGNVSVTVSNSTPCSDVSVATPNIGSQT